MRVADKKAQKARKAAMIREIVIMVLCLGNLLWMYICVDNGITDGRLAIVPLVTVIGAFICQLALMH